MALDSWNLLYGYLGDEELHRNMRAMADFWLLTAWPTKVALPGAALSLQTNTQSGVYDGDMRAGKGYLQPEKRAASARNCHTLQVTGTSVIFRRRLV